ncbi:MAG: Crp/Fnr family transcriptional regulator [Sediminibacterium sp.]|nr:Crp/Fnr family transcriptional regulator [Sediminibacterium sp.]MBX9779813.1 Crp/Fnr family transcriptional regulator [Chitinophagaceae bacterium]
MFDKLYNVISKTTYLDQKDKDLCSTFFEPVTFKRNDIIEVENKIPQNLYFINEGYLRLFYYDDNGDEITTQLSSPESFITSFLSYINQKKATDNLECITDCDLLRISRPKMLELIAASETFKNFSLIIFQEAITTTQSRANDLATLTAEIKYKKLLNEQPQLIQNIPLQYIASYLGIKPQSLSRIRNLLNK